MAINRGPFDALVDDDGSGTTGSVWNKSAIADVVLDPVDAAINPVNAPSTSPHTIGGPLTVGGVLQAATQLLMYPQTADGSDIGNVSLLGGGGYGADRGAMLRVFGNESSAPGHVQLFPGNVAGSSVQIYRNDANVALSVDGPTGIVNLLLGQLKFPATQTPSGDATTIDDYRKGVWQPTLTADGGASGQTYGTREGFYVKSGSLVWIGFAVGLSVKGTLTGNVQIGNLPFPPLFGITYLPGQILWHSTATAYITMLARTNNNASALWLHGTTTAVTTMLGASFLSAADLLDTTLFAGSLTYRAVS